MPIIESCIITWRAWKLSKYERDLRMPTEEELNELNRAFLQSLEEVDPFGLNEKISITEFKCRAGNVGR
jgi:hypothetical protein